jgi:DNA-binding LacI/PurR family transcriptional regulator
MTHRAPVVIVLQESKMAEPHCASNREQVVDTMIDLTRLSHLHRAILAGSDSMELYLALRRRGFLRVATTATCRIPKRQHAVGLITGQNSRQAIEAALAEISQFLSASAAIAILIDSRESGVCLKIRNRLEQMGFRIEAGVRCQQGLVLSAYRQGFAQMENAA